MLKTCSKCGEDKPLDAFYAEKKSPDGRRGDCKTCILAKRAADYADNPEMRARLLRAAAAKRPPTKPRACRRCDELMAPSKGGAPGLCAACKRALGYKVNVSRAQRLEIYERDAWTCQICDRAVEPALHPNHTFAATLDHLIPRSHGGSDDPENLRLAHRICNSARGNRVAA